MLPYAPMLYISGQVPDCLNADEKNTTNLKGEVGVSCISVDSDSSSGTKKECSVEEKRRTLQLLGCTLDRKINDFYRHLSIYRVGDKLYVSSNKSVEDKPYFEQLITFLSEHAEKGEVVGVFNSKSGVPLVLEIVSLQIVDQFVETKNVLSCRLYAITISCFSYEKVLDSVVDWIENLGQTLLILLAHIDETHSLNREAHSETVSLQIFEQLSWEQKNGCYTELSHSLFSVISRLEYCTIANCLKEVLSYLHKAINGTLTAKQHKSELLTIINKYRVMVNAEKKLCQQGITP